MTFEPFELPVGPPQLGVEEISPIRGLMEEAPKFSEGMLVELLHVCRSHVAVRSAFMFSMEIARVAELQLRKTNTLEELKHLQGQVDGLERFAGTLISMMEALEQPTENKDALT